MAKIERVYNVPLRKEFQKAPPYRRAKKATRALREFLEKHMGSENIKIGNFLNELIWARGIKRPPHHVKINVVKDDKGMVVAELVGKPMPTFEKEAKVEKTKADELKEKIMGAAPKKAAEKKSKAKKAMEEKKAEEEKPKEPKAEKPEAKPVKPKEQPKPEVKPKAEKPVEQKTLKEETVAPKEPESKK